MQRVLVVDRQKQPLMPCHPARAREMLRDGKAAVFKRYPFTIILKERSGGDTQSITFKIDPGSKISGLALVADYQCGKYVIWAAEVAHRGQHIKAAIDRRRAYRHSRRARHTRYRQPRFNNRRHHEGWLAPSLKSRVENIWTWLQRLRCACPIAALSQELVHFDTQFMEKAEISGIEYQQGTLAGYEVREYLLDKWQRRCAYCGRQNLPLEIEHIIPKIRGGSNRVSNLTLACHACNQAKGTQTATEFGYPTIQQQAQQSLKDSAAVNTTRWALYSRLQSVGLPVEVGTGGRTKLNRTHQGYPKTHWMDAACVGNSGTTILIDFPIHPLLITATGRQRRQMTLLDKYGFPRSDGKGMSTIHGFKTGDLVKACVPNGKKAGSYIGRVAIRASGNFNITTNAITIQGISYRHCTLIHNVDGYTY